MLGLQLAMKQAPCGCVEKNPGPLRKQQVLLITETSLQGSSDIPFNAIKNDTVIQIKNNTVM